MVVSITQEISLNPIIIPIHNTQIIDIETSTRRHVSLNKWKKTNYLKEVSQTPEIVHCHVYKIPKEVKSKDTENTVKGDTPNCIHITLEITFPRISE